MVTKTKVKRKSNHQKSEWDKLPKREQRLVEDYIYRVLDDKPTKRLVDKIAKLKGIRIKRTSFRN